MDSGNNNPDKSANLPAIANTSLKVLNNLMQLSGDVLKESDPEYWYQKGKEAAKTDVGKKQAFYFFSRCILLNPKHGDAYLSRSLLNANHNEKITDLNKSLEYLSNPFDRTYAFYCRGLYKNKIGDQEGAIRDFNECILLNNSSGSYYYEIIQIKHRQGKLHEALAECNRAINDGIKFVLIYYKSAELKMELHDLEGALRDINMAVKLSPTEKNLFLMKKIESLM